jgi:hypothetical protein
MTSKKKTKRYWDIDFSINYLMDKIKDGSIQPNQNILNAINGIIVWVNNQRKITKNENLLFAKLFYYNCTQFANDYKTTGLDKEVSKKISPILDTPLEVLEDNFYQTFVDDAYNKLNEEKGIGFKHLTRTEEQRAEDSVKIRKMALSRSDIKAIKEPDLNKKNIIKDSHRMITEALNRFQ